MAKYRVFVDDNSHFMDEDERYQLGAFESEAAAIVACQRLVDSDLLGMYEPGMTAARLFELYALFGSDPFVMPVDPDTARVTFSARTYARERCHVLTRERDTSPG